ncbi:MAG: hypothetical protein Q4A98_08285 [Comamonadaceae bacterium]|nr:hypothetical protein [Comamonadaceae bacterium]
MPNRIGCTFGTGSAPETGDYLSAKYHAPAEPVSGKSAVIFTICKNGDNIFLTAGENASFTNVSTSNIHRIDYDA